MKMRVGNDGKSSCAPSRSASKSIHTICSKEISSEWMIESPLEVLDGELGWSQ